MDYKTLNSNLYELKLDGAQYTIDEVAQQPNCWRQIKDLLDQQDPALYQLIAKTLNNPTAYITFCGAGTSAYVGDVLADAIQQFAKARVRSVPTTDIVSRPNYYFDSESEGIVFAFGRSGNSAESVDTADKVSQLAPKVHQINVTCNPNGELAKRNDSHNHVCLMPPETHDKSFVMTSSFSTMLLFTFQLVNRAAGRPLADLNLVADCAEDWCKRLLSSDFLQKIPTSERLVYLGSNTLFGAAKESALKALEMTGGKVVTLTETSLGFRHGPKSIVDETTTACVFVSNNEYTSRFDRDIAIELLSDNKCKQVIVIATQRIADQLLQKFGHNSPLELIVLPDNLVDADDVLLAPLGVLVSQIIGLTLSVTFDISPDNPCPTGEVNRVVQGVTLYEFK
ncbi:MULTISPECIES: SIS domain-containing protein [Pasteurellaceae]|uniref:SIS domain-containing protein n=1 Tax=Pasteurella atlantica TaxID=2827233 RepID=A0AAW8CU94_9PAST|nr:SIS domain-containing protein [Pasteurella atlantica]MBR0574405.1 SIS domain-containing protein [Pasteurella atlantica]MDP8040309.1 SIS domain-containing protein [Pasteurella atlantica]MDP8042435.1 SIS domain-containing protein [Pasteurella atlantica]MDP8044284.1 SIS domain-containing protein [Pasteurella atlantica]MDP8046627.1 SIS domain-containing protein [Pasteurella atlantica]